MRLRLRRARRLKLRTRVLTGVLAVTLAALVAFDVAAVTALRGYLLSQTDARLQSALALYGPLSKGLRVPAFVRPVQHRVPAGCRPFGPVPPGCPPGIRGPRFVALPAALGPFSVGAVTGGRWRVFVGSGPGLRPRVPPGELRAQALGRRAEDVPSVNGHELRLLAEDFPGNGLVYATTSLSDVNDTVGQLELILVIGSAAAGLLAAAGTAWLVRRGLRPVERMAGQADKITAGDLTARVSPHDPRTEVGRLGTALNGMLARIQGFIAEREASQQTTARFFADASHELRNPLASLRANAELYQQGALTDRAQVDEAMRRIAAEARRMGVLVDDMLRLARLDQHPERQRDRVDLTGLTAECVQRARTAHPRRAWHAEIGPDLAADGDQELLRRAIDNLLANVAVHTPPATVATITASRLDGAVIIRVSDDGPGVPPAQLPRIFDRFYRATPSAHPGSGSGLGLAIAAATLTAHHGTIEATPAHPQGLTITLTLPSLHPNPPAAVPLEAIAEPSHPV